MQGGLFPDRAEVDPKSYLSFTWTLWIAPSVDKHTLTLYLIGINIPPMIGSKRDILRSPDYAMGGEISIQFWIKYLNPIWISIGLNDILKVCTVR